jgi:hypothetical protein
LLFYLFGGSAWPLGDDPDVFVGDIRISFDREPVEGDDPPDQQKHTDAKDQESLTKSEIDKVFDHWFSAALEN